MTNWPLRHQIPKSSDFQRDIRFLNQLISDGDGNSKAIKINIIYKYTEKTCHGKYSNTLFCTLSLLKNDPCCSTTHRIPAAESLLTDRKQKSDVCFRQNKVGVPKQNIMP